MWSLPAWNGFGAARPGQAARTEESEPGVIKYWSVLNMLTQPLPGRGRGRRACLFIHGHKVETGQTLADFILFKRELRFKEGDCLQLLIYRNA